MGEMKEIMNAVKQNSKEKKKSNLVSSTQLLIDKGVRFESKNYGTHLIVTNNEITADFWPSTGQWRIRGLNSPYRRGVFKLLSAIGVNP